MKFSLLFSVALFSAAIASPAIALEWPKTALSLKAEVGAEIVRTQFEFKNTSKETVHITGIRTSCSCTEATESDSTVKPGTSGTLYVVFTVGKRTGLQEKEITVLTDDSRTPTRLSLKIKLPDAPAETAAKK